MVPPGTAASAAALTLEAVSPVRTVSPGPFGRLAGSCALVLDEATVDAVELDESAAAAMPALPTAMPVAAAAVRIHARARLRVGLDSMSAPCWGEAPGLRGRARLRSLPGKHPWNV